MFGSILHLHVIAMLLLKLPKTISCLLLEYKKTKFDLCHRWVFCLSYYTHIIYQTQLGDAIFYLVFIIIVILFLDWFLSLNYYLGKMGYSRSSEKCDLKFCISFILGKWDVPRHMFILLFFFILYNCKLDYFLWSSFNFIWFLL